MTQPPGSEPLVRVAAAHAAPVLFDSPATVEKAGSLIREAAANGAQLIAFPETFIPAFPVWSSLRAPIFNHDLFCRLVTNSLWIDGPEVRRLAEFARRHEIVVSMGLNERSRHSGGCLYNANLLINQRGEICNHHRKLMPTFYEKLTWAPGDGAGLRVCPTECGRVGVLICGENTNPLARYAMIAQAEQIHVATYPPIWPTHPPGTAGNYDLAEAIKLRAGAHAFEGKVFNVVASGFVSHELREFLAGLCPEARAILEHSPPAVSLVVGPSGTPLTAPLRDEEGLLYADLDLRQLLEPKQIHDVSGGYNRYDVFQLRVDRTRQTPVDFAD